MHSAVLLLFGALCTSVIAAPPAPPAPPAPVCHRDNLYRSFLDPRYSSSASCFCSSYLAPTVTAGVTITAFTSMTVTTTTTATTTSTHILTKRGPPSTTDAFAGITSYPASRLSSACSCFISSPSPTSTVFSTTVTTITSTQTATSTSSATATSTLYCGVSGDVPTQDPISSYHGIILNATACLSACDADPVCAESVFTDSIQPVVCALYAAQVLPVDPAGAWIAYDKGCPLPLPPRCGFVGDVPNVNPLESFHGIVLNATACLFACDAYAGCVESVFTDQIQPVVCALYGAQVLVPDEAGIWVANDAGCAGPA